MTSTLAHVVAIGAALSACGPAPDESAAPPAAPPEQDGTLSALPNAPAPSSPASASAHSRPAPASGLWAMPQGESTEPTLEEWGTAPTFNTNTSSSREDRCPIAALREWVRFSCSDGFALSPVIVTSKAHFARKDRTGSSTIVARVRPGDLFVVSLVRGNVDVAARVAWPSGYTGPTVAEAWRSPRGALLVAPGDPQPVPAMPAAATERPRPGDWAAGIPVNTAPPERRTKACEARVRSNWLHWACNGKGVNWGFKSIDGFGAKDVDHFEVVGASAWDGDIRLRPGMDAMFKLELSLDGPIATLRVKWPNDQPKPTGISFETTPN